MKSGGQRPRGSGAHVHRRASHHNGLQVRREAPYSGVGRMRADDHRERSPVSRGIRLSRRRFGIIAVGLAAPLFVSRAHAESVPVPVVLQAELLAKVLEYDRNFPSRAGDRTRVLLVTQPTNPDSTTVVHQMPAALRTFSQMSGLPHDQIVIGYPAAQPLPKTCRHRQIPVVYSAPGCPADLRTL